MNNVVVLVNNAWTVFFVPYTVNSCDVTVHTLRKKKKGSENERWIQTHTKRAFGLQFVVNSPGLHDTWKNTFLHIYIYREREREKERAFLLVGKREI